MKCQNGNTLILAQNYINTMQFGWEVWGGGGEREVCG